MYVECHGAGRPLVLIHGWAMHGGLFAPLVRELAPHFCVFVVDLPGHGRSAPPDGEFSVTAIARALAERFSEPAIWAGWSLGGLVALQVAAQWPDKVAALVQIASNPRFVHEQDWPHGVDEAVFRQFGTDLAQDWRGTVERFLALEAHGSQTAAVEMRHLKTDVFAHGAPNPTVLREGLRVLDETDLRAALASLPMPSLWIAGRRDRLVPAAAMRHAAELAQGTYLELPTGHMPFLSHAQTMAQAILEL